MSTRRQFNVDLIADNPPERPACFDSKEQWVTWLATAHQAGVRIVRRVDVGRYKGERSTHFEVLPLKQIDICCDCTESRRATMAAAGRCQPPIARHLLQALKAGASNAVLAKILEAHPIDPQRLRAFHEAVKADLNRAKQAAAAAGKNDRARQHVEAAWRRHQEQVQRGTAEPMTKIGFAEMMRASMATDRRFNDPSGRPFRVKASWIVRSWIDAFAGKHMRLPANTPTTTAPATTE